MVCFISRGFEMLPKMMNSFSEKQRLLNSETTIICFARASKICKLLLTAAAILSSMCLICNMVKWYCVSTDSCLNLLNFKMSELGSKGEHYQLNITYLYRSVMSESPDTSNNWQWWQNIQRHKHESPWENLPSTKINAYKNLKHQKKKMQSKTDDHCLKIHMAFSFTSV